MVKYRAWYTHDLLELTVEEIRDMAERFGIEFSNPKKPTRREIANVFKETFAEMSDPWEVTANGTCKVEKI